MIRIAILDDYQSAAIEFGNWGRLGPDVELVAFADHVSDPDAVVARLRHFDIVVTMRGRVQFTRAVIERLTDLRILITTGYTNPAIDVAAARDCNIIVCGTAGYMESTIELTWGLIIGLLRHIPRENARLRTGGWQHTVGGDLNGATLGVMGLGNMGRGVARIGKAFGMEVVAWSANLTAEKCDEVGARLVGKDELLRTADVVTIHLQLFEARNRGLIGRHEIALMKPSAILVNTSRGQIVVEDDLIDALRTGLLAGAAIDVYDTGPPRLDHPYRSLPNVLATPHLGYVTRNTYKIFFEEIVEDIAAYLSGAPIRIVGGV